MMKKNNIIKSISNEIENIVSINSNNENLIFLIALSGGPDSMCLLDVLCKISTKYNFTIKAIHVHHGIRGKEADSDVSFVKNYCEKQNINLHISYVDAKSYSSKNKISIEEAARILRYRELHNYKNELENEINDKVYILTAHHEMDQVETIIYNMIRGTGISGIVGMKKISNDIFRPLLTISKNDIANYIEENKIPFVIDSTNGDENITRNFIRKNIIPNILYLNKNALKHISMLSIEGNEIIDYIDFYAKKIYNDILIDDTNNQIVVDNNQFKVIQKIIKVNIIKHIFNKLVGTLKDIERIHYDSIIKLSSSDCGGHLDLPYNVTVDKKKKNLIFVKNDENISIKKRKKL